MKPLKLLSGLFCLGCLLGVATIIGQQKQLTELRAEAVQVRAESSPAVPSTGSPEPRNSAVETAPGADHEVLRLRNQVSRLRKEQQELAGVEAEHKHLLVEVAAAK